MSLCKARNRTDQIARGAVLVPEVAEKGWQWSRDGEVVAKIDIRQQTDPFDIVTVDRATTGKSEEYPVALERTPCHYGGERVQ